jgi:nucleoid-associated protein YgaU
VATKTSRSREGDEPQDRHTVADGDTLFSLAEKYYGDKTRFNAIFEANRAALTSPDQLTAGVVLVIPRPDSN